MATKKQPAITDTSLRRAASRAGRVHIQGNGSGKAAPAKRPAKKTSQR